jgi:deoxyadenosine/deoxycytidine kinase
MSSPIPYRYIAIEGNIGAGKTSLAKILSAKFNSRLVLEEFAENTFLPQFYEQPERFAFPLEMSFLAERYQQLMTAQKLAKENNQLLISDYIFDKSMIFASVNLRDSELSLFRKFFEMLSPILQKPDLIIFLEKSTATLQKNIGLRGRSYEQHIPNQYLEGITRQYEAFLKGRKDACILGIKSDSLDFVNDHQHLQLLLRNIVTPVEKGFHSIDPLES